MERLAAMHAFYRDAHCRPLQLCSYFEQECFTACCAACDVRIPEELRITNHEPKDVPLGAEQGTV